MIEIIAMPLLGGLIGYITNDIAIKMLFRPRKPLYIGSFHIPLTPGLIPRQKERIAASIGNVISTQLLNSDTLINTLTNTESLRSVYDSLLRTVLDMRRDERTVAEFIGEYISDEDMSFYKNSIQDSITQGIISGIDEADLGAKLSQCGVDMIKGKMGGGIMSFLLNDDIIENTKNAMSNVINDIIRENAPDIIYRETGKAEDRILDTKICDIITKHEEKIPEITAKFVYACKNLLAVNIDRILEVINIQQIVFDRVNSFDSVELEQMIFGIMRKELKAIVYLGAVLGFLMGFVNIIFLFI